MVKGVMTQKKKENIYESVIPVVNLFWVPAKLGSFRRSMKLSALAS
jgi:hypothetical protein